MLVLYLSLSLLVLPHGLCIVLDQAIDTTAHAAGVERLNKISKLLMKHEHNEDKIKRRSTRSGSTSEKARRQHKLNTLKEEQMISWDWTNMKSNAPTSEGIAKLADEIKTIAAKARQIDRELYIHPCTNLSGGLVLTQAYTIETQEAHP
jgi:hypothetical protein